MGYWKVKEMAPLIKSHGGEVGIHNYWVGVLVQ